MTPMRLTVLLALLCNSLLFAQGQWTHISTLPLPSPYTLTIAAPDQNTMWCFCAGGFVYRSTNGGVNWQLRNTGIAPVDFLIGYALDSSNAWAGTYSGDGHVYRTTDGGLSWTMQLSVPGVAFDGIRMHDVSSGFLIGEPIGGGQPWQFRFTTDGGTNWILSNHAPTALNSEYGHAESFDYIGTDRIWVGSSTNAPGATSARIFRTTSGADGTWTFSTVPGTLWSSELLYSGVAFVDSNNGMIGSYGRDLKRTTNGGLTWTSVTPPSGLSTWRCLNMNSVKDGSNTIRLLVADDAAGRGRIFRTTDFGTNWVQETLPANFITHMTFVNANLGFAGSFDGRVFKYSMPTDVGEVHDLIPKELTLFQNYPNPFNPTTEIRYQIPEVRSQRSEVSHVMLKVYDVLGREVATLVNEPMQPGTHEILWDASGQPTGVYLYRLQAGSQVETRKLIIIR